MAVISTSVIRRVGRYIQRDKLVILQSLKGWRLGGFILTFVTWSRCMTSQISHLCFVGLYAWIIFPVLVCSQAGERELPPHNLLLSVISIPMVWAGLQQCKDISGMCYNILSIVLLKNARKKEHCSTREQFIGFFPETLGSSFYRPIWFSNSFSPFFLSVSHSVQTCLHLLPMFCAW